MRKQIEGLILLLLIGGTIIFAFKYALPAQPGSGLPTPAPTMDPEYWPTAAWKGTQTALAPTPTTEAYPAPPYPAPLQGGGNCGDGWVSKDGSSPFGYNGDQVICKVIVKAGSSEQGVSCYGFTYPPASQSDGCYNVSGLGSTSVSVGGGGTSSECKEISHVEFYACPATDTPRAPTNTPTETEEAPTSTATATETQERTATSTETGTPVASDTPTPVATTPSTPFKFWTPTPRTATPERTETLPANTPTPTGQTPTQVLGTPTPTGTPEPGKPKRSPTGTPELVRLPAAGEGGGPTSTGGAWIGVAIMVIIMAGISLRAVIRSWRNESN